MGDSDSVNHGPDPVGGEDADGAADLVEGLYGHLRSIAQARLSAERVDHSRRSS